ncbi:hypothetical protein [Lewinella sp. LCG006]|uniref:hypothetical protein n=1 Tax=Lewinella sp. LCG006 TaxID=3231911 RepID=UPI003460DD39
MRKKILLVVLLLVFIGTAFWLMRSYYRLPFDQVSPFQAVSTSNSLLLGLPNIADETTTLNNQHLWYLDALRIREVLDSLDLAVDPTWEEWWLMPEVGNGPQEAVYTFIGSARSLGAAWNPTNYGPTINFSGGDIYTFGVASDDPVYFARYHNIFLAGRYPFQVENALLSLSGKIAAWPAEDGFEEVSAYARKWEAEGERMLLRTGYLEDKIPTTWLNTNEVRAYQELGDWLAVSIVGTDSTATAQGVVLNTTKDWLAYEEVTDWDKVPEIVQKLFPLSSSKEPGEKTPLSDWLGAGGWQMELATSSQPDRIAPRLWVLPIGDASAFAKFKNTYLNGDQFMEESRYQLFEMFQLRTAAGLASLSDRKAWQPWVVELPDALLVSVFREEMERYLDYHLLGATLNKQDDFLSLAAMLKAGKGPKGYYRWGPLRDGETNWLKLLFPQYGWSSNGSMYFQMTPEKNGLWSLEGAIKSAPAATKTASLRWTAKLPTQDKLTLLPVRTFASNLPTQFVAQAVSGDCWLLDVDGTILWSQRGVPALYPPVWKVATPGGAPQYFATSKTSLHIWSEEGVAMSLRAGIAAPSAGLTVVAFDQVGDQYLVFPTQEGTLEMLNLDAKAVQGWPAKLSGRTVCQVPITHWQLPQEDLLIAWTGKESWQLFDKFGNFESSLPPVPEEPLGRPGLELNTEDQTASRLIIATASGKINVWDLEGNIYPLPLGRGPVDNFLFSNIWGDGRSDYIVQRGSLVHLFGYAGADFRERWQQLLGFTPRALLPAAPLGIIAVQKSPDQLWLISGEGEIAPGFPLPGEDQALLSENMQGEYFLVTTLRGEVYAYDLIIGGGE